MGSEEMASGEDLSVCLVEYNPLAARLLRQVLEREPRLRIFSQDDAFVPKRVPKDFASVFVVDRGTIPLPLSKFLRSLRFRFQDAPVLLLGEPVSNDELFRLLFLGIQGFLSYDEVDGRLHAAVRALSSGTMWVEPKALQQYRRYLARFSRFKGLLASTLTAREERVVELVQRRLSNKEIGSILGISDSTVKFHLKNIFDKLGVRDRRSAVERVAEHSMEEPLLQKAK